MQFGAFPRVPGQFPVKPEPVNKDRELFSAAGAVGQSAIHTKHIAALHIIRKIIVRVGSITNDLVLTLR